MISPIIKESGDETSHIITDHRHSAKNNENIIINLRRILERNVPLYHQLWRICGVEFCEIVKSTLKYFDFSKIMLTQEIGFN